MNKLLKINDAKYVTLINKLKKLIEGSVFEGHVYIVGGFVRDAIMGRPIKDVDLVIDTPDGGIAFATWATYNTGCFVNEKNPCLFKTYGTAKFQFTNDPDVADIELECVQTRKEKYDNKESRNPSTAFGTIEEDAMRRDLTINALYYNISTDEVCDFTNRGLNDIEHNIIRTTGDANMIFDDDPLRILRVVRFSNRFGWPIEKNTWLGMVTNSKRVSILSQERVTDELNKMLVSENPSGALIKLDRCNVLSKVIPALTISKHVYQHLTPPITLYEHTLAVLDKTPKRLETRLAALFHDVGKIKTYDKNFLFHQNVSAEMTEDVLKAMKYSNAVISKVKLAVEHHEDFSSYMGTSIPRPAVIRNFVSNFDGDDDALDIALDLIHANNITQLFGKKAKLVPGIRAKIAELDKKNESGKNIVIPVNGNEVMAHLGIRPSKILGTIFNKLKIACIKEPGLTKEDALAIAKAEYEKIVV
jgi:tRNA nucleotidyltransferase/poly(A) polymerase